MPLRPHLGRGDVQSIFRLQHRAPYIGDYRMVWKFSHYWASHPGGGGGVGSWESVGMCCGFAPPHPSHFQHLDDFLPHKRSFWPPNLTQVYHFYQILLGPIFNFMRWTPTDFYPECPPGLHIHSFLLCAIYCWYIPVVKQYCLYECFSGLGTKIAPVHHNIICSVYCDNIPLLYIIQNVITPLLEEHELYDIYRSFIYIHQEDGHLAAKSREVSKLLDSGLFSNNYAIWQVLRQQRCRDTRPVKFQTDTIIIPNLVISRLQEIWQQCVLIFSHFGNWVWRRLYCT